MLWFTEYYDDSDDFAMMLEFHIARPSLGIQAPSTTIAPSSPTVGSNTSRRMKCVLFTLLRSLNVSLPPDQEVAARTTIAIRPLVKGKEDGGNMLPPLVERVGKTLIGGYLID